MPAGGRGTEGRGRRVLGGAACSASWGSPLLCRHTSSRPAAAAAASAHLAGLQLHAAWPVGAHHLERQGGGLLLLLLLLREDGPGGCCDAVGLGGQALRGHKGLGSLQAEGGLAVRPGTGGDGLRTLSSAARPLEATMCVVGGPSHGWCGRTTALGRRQRLCSMPAARKRLL